MREARWIGSPAWRAPSASDVSGWVIDATIGPMSSPASPQRGRFRGLVLDPSPLRLDREYRLLWTGQLISVIGRLITQVVLPYQVYVLTNDILAVGLLSIVQLVPILVFSLGGGAVA